MKRIAKRLFAAALAALLALPAAALAGTAQKPAEHRMPVVYLTTDEKNLWDEQAGMLADGPNLDRDRDELPWKQATYWQQNAYPGWVEYYDEAGELLFSQEMTFQATGGYALDMPQKSLAVCAKEGEAFEAALFADRADKAYTSFLLRNGGSEGKFTRLMDGLQARLADQANAPVLAQAWRPVAVYLNGEYYGQYNLRENPDAGMIARRMGWSDAAAIDILKGNGTGASDVLQGSNEEYKALCDFVRAHDLAAEPEALQAVLDQVDLDSLIDYFFLNMFFGNTDPGSICFYRSAQGDGKWRYLMRDMDWGLFSSTSGGPAYVLDEAGMGAAKFQSNRLLRALLSVPDIRTRFLKRGGELFQTVLTTENMTALLDEMEAQIEPEMDAHFARWADKTHEKINFDMPKEAKGAKEYWLSRVERARNVLKKRPALFWDMAREDFSLDGAQMESFFGPRPKTPADAV